MTCIIDYGAGNIRSVEKALHFLGDDCVVSSDENVIRSADRVILPGVGAFGAAMDRLNESGLSDVVREVCASGKPFLGICLGLQLLYERSDEAPGVEGLGILKGEIVSIPAGELKVPHMGWNSLDLKNQGRLFENLPEEPYVYFVHSFYLNAADKSTVKATTEYGVTIDASVEEGNVFACQFHPEKSGEVGLQILRNFLKIA